MRVHQATDVEEFLRLTPALRGREPVLTNVIGSVAGGVGDEAELQQLVEWHEAFGAAAGVLSHDTATSVVTRLRSAGIWWWDVDGTPVSMAGHALPVRTPAGVVSRIGPVYTPAAHRGK